MEAEGQVEEGRPVGRGVAFIEVEVGVWATEGEVGEGGGVGVVEGVGEKGGKEGGGEEGSFSRRRKDSKVARLVR